MVSKQYPTILYNLAVLCMAPNTAKDFEKTLDFGQGTVIYDDMLWLIGEIINELSWKMAGKETKEYLSVDA